MVADPFQAEYELLFSKAKRHKVFGPHFLCSRSWCNCRNKPRQTCRVTRAEMGFRKGSSACCPARCTWVAKPIAPADCLAGCSLICTAGCRAHIRECIRLCRSRKCPRIRYRSLSNSDSDRLDPHRWPGGRLPQRHNPTHEHSCDASYRVKLLRKILAIWSA